MKSLRDRVQLLEGLLREHPGFSPSCNVSHPLQQDAPEPDAPDPLQFQSMSCINDVSNPTEVSDPVHYLESPKNPNANSVGNNAFSSGSPASSVTQTMSEGPSKALVERLLSTASHLIFNPSSRRIGYVGPTKDFDVDSETTTTGSREQNKRADRVLRGLPPAVHDHLVDSFWQFYNPIQHVIDKEAFYEDMASGGIQSYSGFLHVCILAMGFRYADIKRPEIEKLSLSNRESVLHREAKYLVEFEFETPGGEPSVQALLILSELETGCGRDTIGWMYAGMLPTSTTLHYLDVLFD